MGLFSFIGGLLGAGAAKKASRSAETAQLGYLSQALNAEQQQRQQSRTDLAPWMTGGVNALTGQENLLGLNGNGVQQSAIDSLQQSPLYQSLYRNGLEANLQNTSATGGIRGGNEVRSLADFGSDTLAQVIQQQLGNLGGLSQQGQQAAGATVASGDQLTQMISQILGQQGQVRAGGILTRGGITNGMFQNAGNFLGQAASMIPGLGAFGKLF